MLWEKTLLIVHEKWFALVPVPRTSDFTSFGKFFRRILLNLANHKATLQYSPSKNTLYALAPLRPITPHDHLAVLTLKNVSFGTHFFYGKFYSCGQELRLLKLRVSKLNVYIQVVKYNLSLITIESHAATIRLLAEKWSNDQLRWHKERHNNRYYTGTQNTKPLDYPWAANLWFRQLYMFS